MMGNKLLSIIIPVYNNESTIELLISDLLNNPYKNLQLIIGNDCSIDHTYQLIKKFECDPRVKVFNSDTNIGPGAMRNKLISLADGEYIAIQDADDKCSKDRFVEQVDFLEKNKHIDCVGTGVLFSTNGIIWRTFCPRANPSILDWYLQRSMIHASIVFRSELKQIARYHEGLRVGEDYYFLTQLYNQGVKFHNIQKECYIYEVEREKLKKNSFENFSNLAIAKVEISRMFEFPSNIIFLGINLAKLVINFIRSWFYLKLTRKN